MDDRPLGELLRDLSDQTTALVRKEIELAKLELTDKGKRAGAGAGMLVGAAVLGLMALGALVAGAVLLLATALADWLAAVIVAAAVAAIAGILALVGGRQVQRATPPVPEGAAESVKEDVQVARVHARAGRG